MLTNQKMESHQNLILEMMDNPITDYMIDPMTDPLIKPRNMKKMLKIVMSVMAALHSYVSLYLDPDMKPSVIFWIKTVILMYIENCTLYINSN